MSAPEPRLEPVEPPQFDPRGSVGDADLRAFVEAPGWPLTRLAGSVMTLLVAVAIAGPALATAPRASAVALLLPAALATVCGRIVFEAVGLVPRFPGLVRHLPGAVLAAAVATAVMTVAVAVAGAGPRPAGVVAEAVLAGGALLAAGLVRDLEVRLRLAMRRVYFVGAPLARRDLEDELRRRRDARFVGSAGAGTGASTEAVVAAVLASAATVLVLDTDAMRDPRLVEAAARLNLRGVRVRDLVGYYESEFKKVPLAELSPTWFLFDIAQIHRQGAARIARRALELLIAAVLLTLSLPVLAAAAAAIRVTSRGPILFRQRRVGRGGEPFTLHKLRTMRDAGGGGEWAGAEDHRITPVGRHLRRFRIDEIPQLWNVLRGDLSLVGPRPEQVPIVERLEGQIPYYSARHCIRPGLTGWAQVNLGYAGSVEGTVAKLQRDLYYIKHSSLRLDALILWLTLKTIAAGRG